jgi:hypothetical protein
VERGCTCRVIKFLYRRIIQRRGDREEEDEGDGEAGVFTRFFPKE